MNKTAIIAAILALSGVFAFSQEKEWTIADVAVTRPVLQRFGVGEEAQTAALDSYEAYRSGASSVRADLQIKEAELAKLLLPQSPDLAAVRTKLDEIGKLEIQSRMQRIQFELDLRRILGTETWARMRKALRERAQEARNGRGEKPER